MQEDKATKQLAENEMDELSRLRKLEQVYRSTRRRGIRFSMVILWTVLLAGIIVAFLKFFH